MTTEQAAKNLKSHIENNIERQKDDLLKKVESFISEVNRIDTENIMHGSWQIIGLHSTIQSIDDERRNIEEDYARLNTINRILYDCDLI